MNTVNSDKSKNLAIIGSARDDSNTLKALQKIVPNDNYTIIFLSDLKIEHYQYDAEASDDFPPIVQSMLKAETITFATPVYWYSMSGRMKTFFDRLSDLLGKPDGYALAGKNAYLLAVGAEVGLPDGFEVPFRRTSEYFKMNFRKTFYFQIHNSDV